MARVLSVNSNNDIYIAADGSLSLSSDLQAVMQAAQQAVQTQLGEMIFAVDEGVPNFSVIWNGAPNLSQFEAYLRKTILSVEGVTSIESLVIAREGNAVTYTAEIVTIYGPGVLNG